MKNKSPEKKSYLSPKVKLRRSRSGRGLFVLRPIRRNELVVDFSTGPGTYLNSRQANESLARGYDYMIQVGPGKFFAAANDQELEDADFVNHSCAPNCGLRGSLRLVAMRPIKPG